MPDINRYMRLPGKVGEWLDDYGRGPEFMIDHQPTSIVLLKSDNTLRAAQNVRLGYIGISPSELKGAGGQSGQNELVLIGTTDFLAARGDRFVIGTARYEITFVDTSIPGHIEARARSVQ